MNLRFWIEHVANTALWRNFPADFRWLMPELHWEYERTMAAVRAALDTVSFESNWAEGQRLTVTQAIAYALQGDHVSKPPLQ